MSIRAKRVLKKKKRKLQSELKLFRGMNSLMRNGTVSKPSDNRCRQLVPLYDSARIKRVSVNVLACLNMFIAVGFECLVLVSDGTIAY